MDLIGQLASAVGVDEANAQAIAGVALKHVTGAVRDQEGDDAAEGIEAAVPELSQWQDKAKALSDAPLPPGFGGDDAQEEEGGGGAADLLGGLLGGGGGGGGGLLGGLAETFGGEGARDTVAVVQVLGRFGVTPDKAALAAPILLNFLKDRLSPETLSMALKAAPFLASFGGGGDDASEGDGAKEDDGPGLGDVVGALGGLFGK